MPGVETEDEELEDDMFADPDHSPNETIENPEETNEPSGTTANEEVIADNVSVSNQLLSQNYPNTRSRSRREAVTTENIPDDSDEDSEEFFNAEDSEEADAPYSSHYSWFNPCAPNSKFRINFARSAAKIGVSPDIMFAVFAAIQEGVATSYEEAMKSKEKDLYLAAMKAEYEGICSNGTFELAELPSNRKSIKGKWVFRKKFDMHGNLTKIKARWVAKVLLKYTVRTISKPLLPSPN